MAQGPIRHAALDILNCGKAVSKNEVCEALNRIGISNWVKVTKGHNETRCRLTFLSAEEKEAALAKILSNPAITDKEQGPWKAKSVFMRQIRISKEAEESFKAKTARDAISPWGLVPYEEQLQRKESAIRTSIDKWCHELSLENYTINKIIGSPITREYRNKVDFTVGIDGNGSPCAGFRVGSYKEGGKCSFRVELNDDCLLTCPEVCLKVADHLNVFMQQESKLPVYDQDKHQGFWRGLSVRWSARTKQLMVLIRCSGCSDETESEKAKVIEHFRNFEFDGIRVTSLLWQWWNGISFQAAPDTGLIQIFGSDYITEEVLGMKFKVSAGAFFQVNTQGCERLFTIVQALVRGRRTIGNAKKTLILDVCCGTGVIGLLCAGSADHVVGIELSQPAVLDARENSTQNNLDHKCVFICSKAETVFSRLLTGEAKPTLGKTDTVLTEEDERMVNKAVEFAQTCDDIVAIVDPPRAGLHPSVLKALLRCSAVSRIIYVSCNPLGSFVDNAKVLCGTAPVLTHGKDVREKEKIKPFFPTTLTPVDMFPHTEHCELIAEFIREVKSTESELDTSMSQSKRLKIEDADELA